MAKTLVDKWFKDDAGHWVLFQAPTLPLWTWIVATVLAKLFAHGRPHQAFGVVAFVALVIWALLELFKGTNYARRLLGLIVLIGTIYSRVK